MGHVHFKVAGVPQAIAFYRDVLGFGLVAALDGQAAFLAAGGYHHHVGANSWESAGASPPPDGAAALRHASVVLPSSAERNALLRRVESLGVGVEETPGGPLVRDPSGNGLLLGHDGG
jgi:catechol 2,3-dioxygenase